MSRNKKPNFFIMGPPKCGTTSMYHYLRQHPDIFLSPTKETRFFDLEYDKGLNFYENTYFSEVENETKIGEATATYAFLPFVAERLKKHYPKAKLLFCIRNPVDRAFSEWLMRVGAGKEELSFVKAMEANANQGVINLQDEIGAKQWEERERISKNEYRQNYRVYIESGLYEKHLEKYYKLFPKEQILVLDFDEFSKDTTTTLKKVFEFLGVDETYEVSKLQVHNPYSIKKKYFHKVHKVIGAKNTDQFLSFFPKKLKHQIGTKLNNIKVKKPKLREEDKKFCRKFFEDNGAYKNSVYE